MSKPPRRRLATKDKAAPEHKGSARFFVKVTLGPKQSLTPEGFLLCEDVPLARTGEMIYGPDETPIPGVNGQPVKIFRDADELFSPATLASFNGKPVVDEHPDDDVTPKNWRKLACGVLMHVREGEGDNAGLMVGDLLITDATAIDEVKSGKREVSLGYDADYEEVSPGVGRQTNIIGNHVALVERGRCGPRCAIGDRQTVSGKEQLNMPTPNRKAGPARRRLKIGDALAKFKDAADELASELEEEETRDELGGPPGSDDQHIHIHLNGNGSTAPAGAVTDELDPDNLEDGHGQTMPPGNRAPGQDDEIEARFQALEQGHAQILQAIEGLTASIGGGNKPPVQDEIPPEVAEDLAQEAPEGTDPETAAKFRDSASMEDSWKETLALAEVLVPGFRMSTFDAKAKPRDTLTAICSARRKALDAAYLTTDGQALIDTVNSGKPLDTSKMSCAAVRALFKGAAGAKKLINNSAVRDTGRQIQQHQSGSPVAGKIQSIEDLNAMHREFYKKRAATA